MKRTLLLCAVLSVNVLSVAHAQFVAPHADIIIKGPDAPVPAIPNRMVAFDVVLGNTLA